MQTWFPRKGLRRYPALRARGKAPLSYPRSLAVNPDRTRGQAEIQRRVPLETLRQRKSLPILLFYTQQLQTLGTGGLWTTNYSVVNIHHFLNGCIQRFSIK